MASVLYVGERIGVVGVQLAVDLREEDAQHEHRDEDVEQDGEVDDQRHFDADGRREEEHAVLDDEESHHVREDALAQRDEDQSAQQRVERHAEEDQIDGRIGDVVGDRGADDECRERQQQCPRLRRAGAAHAVDLRAADDGEEHPRDEDALEQEGLDGDEGQFGGVDGVQAHQRDGEQQPSLQADERSEVAETLGDREIDERHDVEYDERKDHWTAMLNRSR